MISRRFQSCIFNMTYGLGAWSGEQEYLYCDEHNTHYYWHYYQDVENNCSTCTYAEILKYLKQSGNY